MKEEWKLIDSEMRENAKDFILTIAMNLEYMCEGLKSELHALSR